MEETAEEGPQSTGQSTAAALDEVRIKQWCWPPAEDYLHLPYANDDSHDYLGQQPWNYRLRGEAYNHALEP